MTTRMTPDPPPGAADIDLDSLLRILWRRRLILAGTVFLFVGVAMLVVFQIPPRYTAATHLLLGPRAPHVIDSAAVVPTLGTDTASVHSEIEILRSRTLAEAVVRAQALHTDPEFNATLVDPPAWQAALGLGATPPAPDSPLAHEKVIEAFRDGLRIEPLNRSLVVAVRVTARDPAKAARLADTTAALYLEDQRRAKLATTEQAADWLLRRVEVLGLEATAAEAAVIAYRTRHGLGQAHETSLAAEERARLSAVLADARTAQAEADARHQRLRDALAQIQTAEAEGPGGLDDGALAAVGEVLASPLIHRLRDQEAQVGRQLADLSSRYGPRHPRLAETRAEVSSLRARIADEVERIADAVADEARVAAARATALADSLSRLEQQRAEEGAAGAELQALQRQAAASRALHETVLRRAKEASEHVALQGPDARIVAAAAIPIRASYPRKGLVGAAALVVGLLIGLALVFVVERLDRGLRRLEDVERRLGRPAIGQVPAGRVGQVSPDAIALEEMRQILTALTLTGGTLAVGGGSGLPRVVCVTSSLPEEGKSTLCLWLAATAAANRRVVVVDADLRRPRLAALAGVPAQPDLADVLAGQATLDDALRDGPGGVRLLPARALGSLAGDVVGGAAMRAVIDTLRTRFDLVIVDTPPVLPVADARLVAPLADAVLYSVRWERTPDDVAAQGLARLEGAGPPPLIVLTRVDLRRQASYGYGGHARYYGRYGAYHA